MADKGPPTPRLPTACKPVKTTAPNPQAQQGQQATQHAQQEPAQNPPDEVTKQVPSLNPPAQVLDSIQPLNPPAQVLDPEQPHAPPAHVPDLIQLQNPPGHVFNPVLPPAPPAQILNQMQPQLKWSYFKPEFSGKPEEDVEAHLLRTNDWMETHSFPDVAKVQRFCLTLTSETRLWYESLKPIAVDWIGSQEHFRQQYSKFGNM